MMNIQVHVLFNMDLSANKNICSQYLDEYFTDYRLMSF